MSRIVRPKNRFLSPLFFILPAILMTSGCLKTRAQLRDERESPVSSQPIEVVPQGGYAVEELKAEVSRLNGRVEDLERENAEMKANKKSEDSDALQKLENRVVELEQAQVSMLEAIKKNQSTVAAVDNPTLYEKGLAQFELGNYDDAASLFSQYLKSPNGKFADEATFYRGESFFFQKEYKKAINDYAKFPEKYSKSVRMPKVLLRIGQSFESLGMKEDADNFYQELIEKFPKSKEAKEASKDSKKSSGSKKKSR